MNLGVEMTRRSNKEKEENLQVMLGRRVEKNRLKTDNVEEGRGIKERRK